MNFFKRSILFESTGCEAISYHVEESASCARTPKNRRESHYIYLGTIPNVYLRVLVPFSNLRCCQGIYLFGLPTASASCRGISKVNHLNHSTTCSYACQPLVPLSYSPLSDTARLPIHYILFFNEIFHFNVRSKFNHYFIRFVCENPQGHGRESYPVCLQKSDAAYSDPPLL